MPPSGAVNEYWPILAMAGFGVLFAAGSMLISHLLGERGRQNRTKNTPYECGMPIKTEAHSRFSVKFYLVAMLFILFDVEVVFLYPWAVRYKQLGLFGLAEMALFLAVLAVGWWYVVRKGALDWAPRRTGRRSER